MQKRALAKLPPDEEERLIVHELWLQTKDIKNNQPPPGCVYVKKKTLQLWAVTKNVGCDSSPSHSFPALTPSWMEDNVHQSIRMCHPQERNVHNSGMVIWKA